MRMLSGKFSEYCIQQWIKWPKCYCYYNQPMATNALGKFPKYALSYITKLFWLILEKCLSHRNKNFEPIIVLPKSTVQECRKTWGNNAMHLWVMTIGLVYGPMYHGNIENWGFFKIT